MAGQMGNLGKKMFSAWKTLLSQWIPWVSQQETIIIVCPNDFQEGTEFCLKSMAFTTSRKLYIAHLKVILSEDFFLFNGSSMTVKVFH